MHKNIHVHLYRITIEYTRTLLYNTVRNKENNKHRKEVKKIWREQKIWFIRHPMKQESCFYMLPTQAFCMIARSSQVSKTLEKKLRKGTFDKHKAADLFYYVATSASAMYDKDFGFSFSVQQRFTAAVDMVDFYLDEVDEI